MRESIRDHQEIDKPKILIVDDKSANLVALETLLRELPVEILKAGSGNEALALSLEHEFALVLIDVQMPDMDGFETVELMRQEESTRSVPVIFVSAVYSGDYYKVRGIESGAVDFLEKPIIPELLLGKTRLYLEMFQYKVALRRMNVELEAKVKKRTVLLEETNNQLLQEIERRRQAEKQIYQTLTSLETAQEVARLGFYERNLLTGEGRWSTGTYLLFGVEPGAIACSREDFLQRVHEEDREMIAAALLESERGYKQLDMECRFVAHDGVERVLRLVGATELDEKETPLVHRGMLQDITERKQAEIAKLEYQTRFQHTQKLESLGVLAGGIAHDFNNLLLAILGNADLALMKISPLSPGRDYLNEVIIASKRAADLCRQMLAYSGKGKFVIERVDLAAVAEEMGHLLSVSVSKKAIIKYDFAGDVPPVDADATQIRQIIMNLVTNASEAIGDRDGVISIATGSVHCDREYLDKLSISDVLCEGLYSYVEVADTGCGMEQEILDKLFDPFFTTKFTGRGLGLSAVLGIVRGHHGTIRCTSKPGEGTVFRVLLPAAEVVKEDTDMAVEVNTDFDWQGTGTVLIVDDEDMIRAIASSMLENMGFRVLNAVDGQNGLEVFAGHASEIVCVLLDLTMPKMGGEECFHELRALRSDLPVLISSGYTVDDISKKFSGADRLGFVQKPYTYEQFKDSMQNLLSGFPLKTTE